MSEVGVVLLAAAVGDAEDEAASAEGDSTAAEADEEDEDVVTLPCASAAEVLWA